MSLPRLTAAFALAAATLAAAPVPTAPTRPLAEAGQGAPTVSVRITSPQGRTGVSGRIRIVAQIVVPPGSVLGPVHFFVDGEKVGEDIDGAPYAAEWVDENPFERREIAVAVADQTGAAFRDTVVLEPFEFIDVGEAIMPCLKSQVWRFATR
jgi:hypothetical protein